MSSAEFLAGRSRRPLALLCLWLVLLPLPLGANRPWAMALVLPPLLGLAAVQVWSTRLVARPRNLAGFVLSYPGLLLTAFCGLLAFQLAPWVDGKPVSVVPGRTSAYLLVALSCALVAWLIRSLVRDAADVRMVLKAFVAAGVLQALIAVFLLGTRASVHLVDTTLGNTGVATGSFVNRNHLAAYLNLCLAAAVGMLLGGLSRHRDEGISLTEHARRWLELLLSPKAQLRLLAILMVIALILTRSRGGNGAFFIGLLGVTAVHAALTRSNRKLLLVFVASILVVDLALIGAWVGVDKVVDRIESTAWTPPEPRAEGNAEDTLREAAGESTETAQAAGSGQASADKPQAARAAREETLDERVEPAFDGIGIIRDHPWIGMGGGTFFVSYMAYAQKYRGYLDHAHNDYIELAADTGLPGLALLTGYALAAGVVSLVLIRRRHNVGARSAACAAVMALGCLIPHLYVDFPLQIPAYAISLTALLTLPFAAAAIPSRRHRSSSSRAASSARLDAVGRPAPGPLARAAGVTCAVLGTLLFAWMALEQVRQGMADYLMKQAVLTSVQVANAPAAETAGTLPERDAKVEQLAAIDQSLVLLVQASTWSDGNPTLHDSIGFLRMARSRLDILDASAHRADQQAAAAAYRDAVGSARVSPYSWANLVLAKQSLGEIDDEFRAAVAQADRFGPHEPGVQLILLSALLTAWPELGDADRQRLGQVIERGWETQSQAFITEAREAPHRARWCAPAVIRDSLPMRALCHSL